MSDLSALLDRTTPAAIPVDVVGLLRSGRRRRARRRVLTSAAVVSTVVVGVAGVMAATTHRATVDVATSTTSGPIGRWAQVSTSPLSARTRAVGVTLSDGRVLVWGGSAAGSSGDDPAAAALSDGAIFDPTSGSWRTIPAGPTGFRSDGAGFTSTAFRNDRLAVMTRAASVVAAVFDVGTDRWIEAPPVPELHDPLLSKYFAFDGTTLTVLGRLDAVAADPVDGSGVPARPERIAALRWTIGSDSWVEGSPAPVAPRFSAGVGASADGARLAFWGGQRRNNDVAAERGLPDDPTLYDDGAIYDVGSDSWTALPRLGLPPTTQATVRWVGDRVVVGGGLVVASSHDGYGDGSAGGLIGVGPIAGQPWVVVCDPSSGVVNRSSTSTDFLQPVELVGDGTYVAEGSHAGSGVAIPTSFLAGAAVRWRSAPERDLHVDGDRLVATSAAGANPGDRTFSTYVADIGGRDWQQAATAPFANRMDATVVSSGRYVLVTGGLEGRHIAPTTESWLLTLPDR